MRNLCEVKLRCALAKLQILLKLGNPAINHAQSAACSPQCISRICDWLRHFLPGLYAFRKQNASIGKAAGDFRLRTPDVGRLFETSAFPRAEVLSGNRLNIEIYTDARARPPLERDTANWGPGSG